MNADGIIFDLDGTLWDSTPEILKTWQMVLDRHPGLREPITMDELQSLMGLPMTEIARRLFPGESPETQMALMDECCVVENEYLAQHGATLYPELVETLLELKKTHKLCIVSNAQSGYIEAFMTAHKLWNIIDDHLAFGDTKKSKGENNLEVIRRNGFKHPVYVGDTQGDLQSAMDAGIPFVFCEYGFGNVDHFDAKISSFKELLSLFC